MPRIRGRRRTRRHSHRHRRRRGATPERPHSATLRPLPLPAAQQLLTLEELLDYHRFHVEQMSLIYAHLALGWAEVFMHGTVRELSAWFGDAADTEMDSEDLYVDPDRLCQPRVRELCDRHNRLARQVGAATKWVEEMLSEGTDMRTAISVNHGAVDLRDEIVALKKDIQKLTARKRKVDFVLNVLITVAIACIVCSLFTSFLWHLSKVLGYLDNIATTRLSRDCMQLTGHVIVCHIMRTLGGDAAVARGRG